MNPSGAPRPPFDNLIQRLVSLHRGDTAGRKSPVIVSVDIPSGWHVQEGDVSGEGIKPDMLVYSLKSHIRIFSKIRTSTDQLNFLDKCVYFGSN